MPKPHWVARNEQMVENHYHNLEMQRLNMRVIDLQKEIETFLKDK
jgi:hypothetical protein